MSKQDNSERDYKSGIELLAQRSNLDKEGQMRWAIECLMFALEDIHSDCHGQSLKDNLTNPKVYCSCADAYRIGHEVLKG